jgi:transposase
MTITLTTLPRGTGIEDPGPVDGAGTQRPDPEVPERARRRTFTAKNKLAILAEYDAAADGEKGALLRREGLYSSHIDYWRKARDGGVLAGLGVLRGRPQRDPPNGTVKVPHVGRQYVADVLVRNIKVVSDSVDQVMVLLVSLVGTDGAGSLEPLHVDGQA